MKLPRLRRTRREGGQASTEYFLVISVVMIGLVASAYTFVPSFRLGVMTLAQDVELALADHEIAGLTHARRTPKSLPRKTTVATSTAPAPAPVQVPSLNSTASKVPVPVDLGAGSGNTSDKSQTQNARLGLNPSQNSTDPFQTIR